MYLLGRKISLSYLYWDFPEEDNECLSGPQTANKKGDNKYD